MSLDASGEYYRKPVYWSSAALRDAVRRAIQDAQSLPLPRALSVDKIFRPLVRQIQYDQYQHMHPDFFPISCDLLILDLSLNYMMFTTGNLAPYPGITETELNMIAFFDALQRDEICEEEVMNLARRLVGPSLQAVAEGYLKIHGKPQHHSISTNTSRSKEVLCSTPPKLHISEVIDSHTKPPSSCSSAIASTSDDPDHTNTFFIPVPRTESQPLPLPLHISNISAEPRSSLSSIHPPESSTPVMSAPKSPVLGVSRSPNLLSTPSPIVSSSKYLGAKRQSVLSSRRSSMANKENIPPKHRR